MILEFEQNGLQLVVIPSEAEIHWYKSMRRQYTNVSDVAGTALKYESTADACVAIYFV